VRCVGSGRALEWLVVERTGRHGSVRRRSRGVAQLDRRPRTRDRISARGTLVNTRHHRVSVPHSKPPVLSADGALSVQLLRRRPTTGHGASPGEDVGGRSLRAASRRACPGDLALIYLPTPEAEFIGRVECATAVHDWTPSEAEAYPGDSPSGVLLSHVEEWDPAVPMDTVVERIDPTASNPLVQANAAAGFRMDVVRIPGDEYEAALALSREARGT
jgi:hypothetical protein